MPEGRKAAQKDKDAKAEYDVLAKIKETLLADKPIRTMAFNEQEKELLKGFHFLTLKPVIYIANIDEASLADPSGNSNFVKVEAYATANGSEAIAISARVEEELSTLDDADRDEYLHEIGVNESGLDKIVHSSYHVLDLCTYFTCGEVEVRAWTFLKGMKAPQCAGIIHTDFEKGFIRAETYSYQDIMTYKTELAVKEAGKLRLEGKDGTGW